LASEIPGDAILIEQTHNIDTNQLWVKFIASEEGIYGFTSACTPITNEKTTEQEAHEIRWWKDGVREAGSNILHFRCNAYEHGPIKVNLDVMIDKSSRVVWYSRASK